MPVLTVADIGPEAIDALLNRFDLAAEYVSQGQAIAGSFWGGAEAGIIGKRVFVREDTPVHSMLHEF